MSFRPERFGKYFLVDKIAVGGMAEIFKAKQFGEGGFEKILVIKRILSHLSEDQDFVKMFCDEAMISSTLNHSNIVHVFDFGKIRNNYFIAMEYCEGKDLKTVMKKCQEIGRPLPVEYAVYIIHEVCKGLDHAHRKKGADNQELNILHRDISPSNVMLSYEEGRVKLADFGIAKAENASYKTRAGVLKGKFEYMSPEQASGLAVDRRSDVFSIGICFYELLTRRRLFKTDSDLKTLELIRNPLIPPPSHLNPQVREELDAIVMKALTRNPDDRYQEAWQMQHALREYMRNSSPPTSPDLIALSLANFMKEIFDREIRQERERLEAGTRIARDLLSNTREAVEELEYEENWDIPSGNSRVTGMTPSAGSTAVRLMIEEQKRSSMNRPLMVGGLVAALVVAGGLVLKGSGSKPEPAAATDAAVSGANMPGKATPAKKSLATLQLSSSPVGARILLAGEPIGSAPLVYQHLPAEETVEVRVEAAGYQPYVQKLFAQAGGIIDLKVELKPEGGGSAASSRPAAPVTRSSTPVSVPAAPASVPAAGPVSAPVAVSSGRLEFYSTPTGASVTVDGRSLCQTPCAMENGRAEATYEIEIAMEGYAPYRSKVRFPGQGSSRVAPTLQRQELGTLTLTIKDGLSAEIFIDGQSKGVVPLLDKLPLPAGRRTIRLRNQIANVEKTITVDIQPGQETRKLGIDLRE